MTKQDFTESMNCQGCGGECFVHDLKTIKLSGFDNSIVVCNECLSKTADDCFRNAADILKDIIKIAVSSKDPEKRLLAIRSLLGE
jgi:predicted metal-binding protein